MLTSQKQEFNLPLIQTFYKVIICYVPHGSWLLKKSVAQWLKCQRIPSSARKAADKTSKSVTDEPSWNSPHTQESDTHSCLHFLFGIKTFCFADQQISINFQLPRLLIQEISVSLQDEYLLEHTQRRAPTTLNNSKCRYSPTVWAICPTTPEFNTRHHVKYPLFKTYRRGKSHFNTSGPTCEQAFLVRCD